MVLDVASIFQQRGSVIGCTKRFKMYTSLHSASNPSISLRLARSHKSAPTGLNCKSNFSLSNSVMGFPARRRSASIAVATQASSGPQRNNLVLSTRASLSDQVEVVHSAASRVNTRLRALAGAVDVCNAAPAAVRVEAVESAAAAARVELVRLREMRDGLRAGEKAREIADSHFENAAKRYARELLRLKTSVVNNTEASPPASPTSVGRTLQGGTHAVAITDPELVNQARDVQERTRELERLRSAFQGINTLVEELNMLVVNQGEALDAADGNVEEAQLFFEQGYTRLSRTKRIRDKIRKKKILVGSVVAVVVVVGVVIVLVLLL